MSWRIRPSSASGTCLPLSELFAVGCQDFVGQSGVGLGDSAGDHQRADHLAEQRRCLFAGFCCSHFGAGFVRAIEHHPSGLFPVCRAAGLGVLPWSLLRAGWLSGAHWRGTTAVAEGTRVKAQAEAGTIPWSGYATERTWRVIDEVSAMAAETGRSAAQVSLRWLLQRAPVTAPVIGSRSLDHVRVNLATVDWALTSEQVDCLTAASETEDIAVPVRSAVLLRPPAFEVVRCHGAVVR
jgi:aryl-alcohol dehydrogenase-like predicted oxidoreductase